MVRWTITGPVFKKYERFRISYRGVASEPRFTPGTPYTSDELVSLPWIGILTSLQTLQIWSCPNLISLPQEIRNLTSLKELRIWRCPLLRQRCKRQIGEDWPIIAHVPIVYVDGQNQQEETISSGMHLINHLIPNLN